MYLSHTGLKSRWLAAARLGVGVAVLATAGMGTAFAAGGTPAGTPTLSAGDPTCPGFGQGTQTDPNQCPPVPPAPVFTAALGQIHQFHIVGFIQNATVSSANCPGLPASQWGGTAVVNGVTITIPCNTTLQFPANTFTWADMFDPTKIFSTQTPPPGLTLPLSAATFGAGVFQYPTTEITIDGNLVGTQYISGLITISQQSLNAGVGFITGFDYANGAMLVSSTAGGPAQVRLQINDKNGRFSAGQTPDFRFNVDDTNPTIHAGTGYPMCIPRTDPAVADDPKCPARNRPKADANGNGCRNFSAAGVIFPKGGELFPTPPGQFCTGFVMKDPALALATDPISTQQAPFEIGDFIQYSGTLLEGSANGPNGTDTISVHTINGIVGIFTQPNTLPSYVAIDEFGVGAGANSPLTFNGVPQEVTPRLFIEARTTDVKSILDIYMVDLNPTTGAPTYRWLTPISMTAENGAVGSNGLLIDGGITTQFTRAQIGRARVRVIKPPVNLMAAPTRYMAAAVRSLCDPANINGSTTLIGPDGKPVAGTSVPCTQRAPAANGLFAGQYVAPQFGFIFPENVIVGDPVVAANLWDLPFLNNGGSGLTTEGPGTGQLIPTPW